MYNGRRAPGIAVSGSNLAGFGVLGPRWGAWAHSGKVKSNSPCHDHTTSRRNEEALLWRTEQGKRGGEWEDC